MFEGFLFFYLFFGCGFLAKLWRTHFWEYRRRFCTKRRVSVGIDFLRGRILKIQNFPPINSPKHHFFGLRKFSMNIAHYKIFIR